MNSQITAPFPASSGDPSRRLPYVDYIRSCYRNDPEAFSYYEELVDYIEKITKKSSNLCEERPRVFEAQSVMSPISYPALFPFDPLEWSAHSEKPRIVMLEGFPSPDAVLQLAYRWNLRPEFFIGHIFGSQNSQRGFYSIPTLPSRQENIIRIHFSSLVKSLAEGTGLASYLEKKSEVEEACRQYEKRLLSGDRYGVTRYREIHQHDTYYCSVEHITSFTVVVNKSSWVAVYLTDQGKSLLEDVPLPWSTYHGGAASLKSGTAVGTVPIVPYNAPITPKPFEYHHAARNTSPSSSPSLPPENTNNHNRSGCSSSAASFGQLHPPRNIVVHDEIDMRLLSEDPFYLLACLFTTSALSFVQLLNYLSVSVSECRSTEISLLNVKLERLRHCVRIIHRVESALDENMHWIIQGGCASWPRVRPGTDTAARKAALQTRLRTDHEALHQRCIIMRQECDSAMLFLVDYSQLLCGERGIAQEGEVHGLNKLASFFVPLAFVATLFGMNVKELQGNSVSLWTFVTVAVVVSAATYATIFWPTVRHWLSMTRRKMGLKGKRAPQTRDVDA
ncbi:uncharacterized protein F4822DRAFT_106251 [Hypoxylon trugodes]|uniref:uncharacterized protein n=1 Tax=Hypoxylon trugodes TaxID=326681 RepID=UPI0021921F01|nr:uncharacterized protein F4822DRAFT_106251 [Hypoxylon trugodes]KAI1391823.1 hypothetical protein F4822DRAFT_106251 [Hypoxylon trugodes]